MDIITHMYDLMNSSRIGLYWIVLYFAIYAFFGWVIESIFRSVTTKKITNAGFLYGFFVPLYGLSAIVMILVHPLIQNLNLVSQVIILGILVTIVEYLGGVFSEYILGAKLWDYSDKILNIQGRICVQFSVGWTILALFFITFIHPNISLIVTSLNEAILSSISFIIIIYFFIDISLSTIEFSVFMDKLKLMYNKYAPHKYISDKRINVELKLQEFKRLLIAFPYLRTYLPQNIFPKNISKRIKKKVENILHKK